MQLKSPLAYILLIILSLGAVSYGFSAGDDLGRTIDV